MDVVGCPAYFVNERAGQVDEFLFQVAMSDRPIVRVSVGQVEYRVTIFIAADLGTN